MRIKESLFSFQKKYKKIFKKVLTILFWCAIIILAVENKFQSADHGSIAQLGEHLPYKQRVIGSSPIVSTKRRSR